MNHAICRRFFGAAFLICALLALPACQSNQNSATTKPVEQAERPTVRIKAGVTSDYKDPHGNVWMAEKGFDGGDTTERAPDLAIANTDDPNLYRSEHYGMSAFTTDLPNGKYIVKLYFADTYEGITGPGQRVFNFTVQGKEFKDFDIWAKAGGGDKAYVETVPVEVTNGKLQITFTANVENPEINAIEIVPSQGRE